MVNLKNYNDVLKLFVIFLTFFFKCFLQQTKLFRI